MRQRDRQSGTDPDVHDGLFFGASDDDASDEDVYDDDTAYGTDDTAYGADDTGRPGHAAPGAGGLSRVESRRRTRQRRRRGVFGIVAVFFVAVVVALGVLIGVPIYHYFSPSDYSGQGSGSVIVTVHSGDGASQIGATLASAGVVASQRAFTDAAADDSSSRNIQPGSYRLSRHMSAQDALDRLLSPSARVDTDVVVTEGQTVFDIEKTLSSPRCSASSPKGTTCGLGLSSTAVTKALSDVSTLGLPTEFTKSGTPKSAEGFLFPATYPFDDTTTVESALQTMVGKFTDQARSTDFTARASALHLTPYQELVIASMVQSEAKYPDDMAKVARVILNRLQANMFLGIDATSIYGAEVNGVDPATITHSNYDTPYNTYTHHGLPPTPISNPGAEAMNAAAHPATGNWLYYVNSSPDRLFFTNSQTAFAKAEARCEANNWGCG